MSTKIDQKEYLRKYVSGDVGEIKKKKKKKPKDKSSSHKAVTIIDDDIDLSALVAANDDEFDSFNLNEELPQIAGIIDERPPELIAQEDYKKNSKWKVLESSSVDTKQNLYDKHKSSELLPQLSLSSLKREDVTGMSKDRKRTAAGESRKGELSPDTSPPRRKIISPDTSPPRRRARSPDASPPRRRNRSPDQSPSRRMRRTPDITPPRRRNRSPDRSPPRRRNGSPDRSPPRRRNRSPDRSPPRRPRRSSDRSPPRRKKESSDHSPSRRKQRSRSSDRSLSHRRNRTPDTSPPRKRKQTSSSSSPRRKNKSPDASPPRRKSRSRNSDASPPRRRNKSPRKDQNDSGSSDRRRPRSPEPSTSHRNDDDKQQRKRSESPPPTHKKMAKTLEGKAAGLQNAKSLREENENFRKREDELYKKMAADIPNGSEAVVRDRKTGRRRDLQQESEKEMEKMKKQEERKAVYDRWGRGVKQIEEHKMRVAEQSHEQSKPLARYSDDKDLDEFLKKQSHIGDPMADYFRRKAAETKTGPSKPIYQGSFPENRFNIRPGYRWDGVDRTNGYENKWFEMQSKKKAGEEEAYKYSVEDM